MILLFVGSLFVGGLFSLVGTKQEISFLERRKLMTEEVLKKDFIGNFDTYLADHFILRDSLLSLSSLYERNLLQNQAHRGVFIQDGYLIEQSKTFEEKKVQEFAQKLDSIYQTYFLNHRVFYTLIPDKASFLESNLQDQKYEKIYDMVREHLSIPYIDITNEFSLTDYFRTDIHLKQSAYFKVLKKWIECYELPYFSTSLEEKSYSHFAGVSLSKVPSFSQLDDLIYYDYPMLHQTQVNHLEYGLKPVYDLEKLQGMDSYEVFLSGPSALIEIENLEAISNRELVVFRDSFGSSFVPLLIPYYQKITVIDLRYISLPQAVPYFQDSTDVLFAYSTLLVLDSPLLKVPNV